MRLLFEAVVAIGVPFGGRGQMGFPGSPHGEIRPRDIERAIAGPDLAFYQEYFRQPGVPEQAVPDLRGSIVFKNCGHWIQQQRREDFNRVLLDFLRDVKPVAEVREAAS